MPSSRRLPGGEGLDPQELERYHRQILIPGLEKTGQEKLKRSHVLIAGLGGLGCPAAMYLAVAGVGRLTLVDAEKVELSNLNRQVLHWHQDVGRPKAESAVKKLQTMNPSIRVESKSRRITTRSLKEVLEGVDLVVDGMDNYPARYLLNQACVRKGIPFIHGAVEGLVGQLTTILPGRGPCLRCIIPKEPPPKPVFPVLGATAGVIACLQAMEAVKLLTGLGQPLVGRMMVFDGGRMTFDEIEVQRNPKCPVCKGV